MEASKHLSAVHPLRIPPTGSGVVDQSGEFGTVVSWGPLQDDDLPEPANQSSTGDVTLVTVQHREHRIALPIACFEPVEDDVFQISFRFDELIEQAKVGETRRIPLLREELHVDKRTVVTGKGLRIHKTIIETPHVIENALTHDHFSVTHVPHNRFLEPDAMPITRYEGTTMIIPVIEEVLVVEKRLRLKEEVHIVHERRTVPSEQLVYLKSDQVKVERFDEGS